MSEDEKNASNWLKVILEGGVPQILAGPAGKAISRLIGAITDIPAARLEARAQEIRDQTDAKSQVSQMLANLVAEKAGSDPAMVERAMDGMVAKAYRTQANKDAVAMVAVQDLLENPPKEDGEDIKEDWLNKFERYAEDASSDDLRTTFGRLLAAEVRSPGKIAASTLHFVSILEPETAKLIERILPFVSASGAVFSDAMEPKIIHLDCLELEDSGFWSSGSMYSPKFLETGKFAEWFPDNKGVGLGGDKGAKIGDFPVYFLTRAGRDLVDAVAPSSDLTAVAKFYAKQKAVDEILELSKELDETSNEWRILVHQNLSHLIPER